MFGSLGLPELLVILLIVVIIFGANKLPQLGKGFGQGLRDFKDAVKGVEPAPPAPRAAGPKLSCGSAPLRGRPVPSTPRLPPRRSLRAVGARLAPARLCRHRRRVETAAQFWCRNSRSRCPSSSKAPSSRNV